MLTEIEKLACDNDLKLFMEETESKPVKNPNRVEGGKKSAKTNPWIKFLIVFTKSKKNIYKGRGILKEAKKEYVNTNIGNTVCSQTIITNIQSV